MSNTDLTGPEKALARRRGEYKPPLPREGIRPTVQNKAKEIAITKESLHKAYLWIIAQCGDEGESRFAKKKYLSKEVIDLLGKEVIDDAITFGGIGFRIKQPKTVEGQRVRRDFAYVSIEYFKFDSSGNEEVIGELNPRNDFMERSAD